MCIEFFFEGNKRRKEYVQWLDWIATTTVAISGYSCVRSNKKQKQKRQNYGPKKIKHGGKHIEILDYKLAMWSGPKSPHCLRPKAFIYREREREREYTYEHTPESTMDGIARFSFLFLKK